MDSIVGGILTHEQYLDEVVVVIIYVCAGYVLAFLFALVYAKLGRIQMMLTPALPHLRMLFCEGSPFNCTANAERVHCEALARACRSGGTAACLLLLCPVP